MQHAAHTPCAQTCYHSQGADVVFAKTYRGDVLLTVIWYGPSNSYYVSLSPASGEEQALVDTLFPSIYGALPRMRSMPRLRPGFKASERASEREQPQPTGWRRCLQGQCGWPRFTCSTLALIPSPSTPRIRR